MILQAQGGINNLIVEKRILDNALIENQKLHNKIEKLEASSGCYNGMVKRYKNKIKMMKDGKVMMEYDFEVIKNANIRLSKTVKSLESKIEDLEEDLEDRKEHNEVLQTDLTMVKEDNSNLQEEIDRLKEVIHNGTYSDEGMDRRANITILELQKHNKRINDMNNKLAKDIENVDIMNRILVDYIKELEE